MPISLAHKLAKKLTEVRKSGELDYLRPDGKSQGTVEYVDGKPVRVDAVVISSQHSRQRLGREQLCGCRNFLWILQILIMCLEA